jgi:hypothetical protein
MYVLFLFKFSTSSSSRGSPQGFQGLLPLKHKYASTSITRVTPFSLPQNFLFPRSRLPPGCLWDTRYANLYTTCYASNHSQATQVTRAMHRASSASALELGRFYNHAHHHRGGTITVKTRLMEGPTATFCLAERGDRLITCSMCGYTPSTAGQILLDARTHMCRLLLIPSLPGFCCVCIYLQSLAQRGPGLHE